MTYYEILGVTPEAGFAEIKTNYRNLVKQYHPDLNPSEEAKELIILITEAYEVLSNPSKKYIYDQQLNGVELVVEEEPQVDEYELFRQDYIRRNREKEEHHWRQLFAMKVKFYKMQRYFAVFFVIVSLVYSYDYFFTEIWHIEQVDRVLINGYGEGTVICGKNKFITTPDIYYDFVKSGDVTVNVHFSWLHGEPVGLSFEHSSKYYILYGTLHSYKNFFPVLLLILSVVLLVYHEYNDWLLTIGLLPFFIVMFLFLFTYMMINGGLY